MLRQLSVLCNLSKHSYVIETMAPARHEDIRRVIAEGLDRPRSLPELGATNNSVVGDSSGTSGDIGNFSAASASSS